jgi:ABC-type dipeptide/oligopeptide/nickel transport system permease component
LFIAVVAVGLAVMAGIVIGSVSGFIGGTFDNLVMRLVDMVLAFPSFVLALVFVAVLGPTLGVLVIALSLRFIPMYARLVRAEIWSEKLKEYALVARAIGRSDAQLVLHHLLPNYDNAYALSSVVSIQPSVHGYEQCLNPPEQHAEMRLPYVRRFSVVSSYPSMGGRGGTVVSLYALSLPIMPVDGPEWHGAC